MRSKFCPICGSVLQGIKMNIGEDVNGFPVNDIVGWECDVCGNNVFWGNV